MDRDILQRHKDTERARRRVTLCFLALIACIFMIAGLIPEAGKYGTEGRGGSHITMDDAMDSKTGISRKTVIAHSRL